jgi:hypothetical protein
MEDNQNLIIADLQVDSIALFHLKETAMWSRFLAIAGFVVSGLYVVIAIFAGTLMSGLTKGMGSAGMMGATTLTIIYLLFGGIGFVVSLFKYRFATQMKTALQSSDQENLTTAFLNLKFVYRFYGIVMIILLGLMVLGIIIAVAAAVFASR